jgi:hypothetical protein
VAKNYYLILGVPLDASPDEIRSAFRKLALRYHPDRREEPSTVAFRDIFEAYGVLSDPARRAGYDREVRRRNLGAAGSPASTRVLDPEPLISQPVALAGRPESVRPSYESLLDRLARNFAPMEAPKAERKEPLDFELILTPDEAARGILVPFHVPVFSTCYQCGGLGRHWLFPCAECDGRGRFVDHEAVEVHVPAGIRDGTVLDVTLESFGIRNLWLRVYVRIGRQ